MVIEEAAVPSNPLAHLDSALARLDIQEASKHNPHVDVKDAPLCEEEVVVQSAVPGASLQKGKPVDLMFELHPALWGLTTSHISYDLVCQYSHFLRRHDCSEAAASGFTDSFRGEAAWAATNPARMSRSMGCGSRQDSLNGGCFLWKPIKDGEEDVADDLPELVAAGDLD
ncbi:hypothetical protein B0H17DRAFT_1143581 [Mycena rosella]|uniref:Uncharacterized protein n=1 Tax=Mycena rosella TaxID=1033263 RepID=A0AAD7CYQ4_MYCRO|nr:hypothetical protein B0H17DRAFT_1143581 [Mycena rosella]